MFVYVPEIRRPSVGIVLWILSPRASYQIWHQQGFIRVRWDFVYKGARCCVVWGRYRRIGSWLVLAFFAIPRCGSLERT